MDGEHEELRKRLVEIVRFRGDRLRTLRHAKGVSADRLAMMTGITARHIFRIEKGTQPQVWGITVGKLALALGTSTDYLLNITDDPSPCPGTESESVSETVLQLAKDSGVARRVRRG